jgi:hypothetical protein
MTRGDDDLVAGFGLSHPELTATFGLLPLTLTSLDLIAVPQQLWHRVVHGRMRK